MTDRIGQPFGNYRLVRLLGQGGFADVYLAEHTHLETLAAVKVLSVRLTSEHIESFRTEARTIARLIHPHIVRILDFGVEQETPYLVMDYASLGPSNRYHPRGTRLPLSTVVTYVKQIAGALQYAHEKGVIHRDIKPENLLLGEHRDMLLSDFGIALITQSSRNLSVQGIEGTMPYMAPEQIQGKPRRASDQYALGIVVYEWLTGDRPFHGSVTEIVGQHLAVPPPSLREKAPAIAPAVEDVVLTALQKDPSQRFVSMHAFAVALEQASQSLRPSAPITKRIQPSLPLSPVPPPNQPILPESAQTPMQRALPLDPVVPPDQSPPPVHETPLIEPSIQPDVSTTSNFPFPQWLTNPSLEQPVSPPPTPMPVAPLKDTSQAQAALRTSQSRSRRAREPVKKQPHISPGRNILRPSSRKKRVFLTGAFLLLAASVIVWRLLVILPSPSSPVQREKPTEVPEPSHALNLHVEGNRLFDAYDRPVRLIGANRSGTEYQCLTYGVFDGPNDQASIDAMLRWHINVIRIPMNEDCWLNINMGTSPYGGKLYQEGIDDYVHLLISNGITPILELHATAPGTQQATTKLEPMPDRDHSIPFWKEVAKAYKNNTAVIFDLFNEPFPDNNRDTLAAWNCWRDGTNPQTCPLRTAGLVYDAAGMRELIGVVRDTGAKNVIMLGGIQYAATLDHWLDFVPPDPQQELVASWHLYNYYQCNASSCWVSQALPVMKYYSVIVGAIGENDARAAFILRAMSFLDHPGTDVPPQNYLAWAWNTDLKPYDLITDYKTGTPSSPYGLTYMQHVLSLRP